MTRKPDFVWLESSIDFQIYFEEQGSWFSELAVPRSSPTTPHRVRIIRLSSRPAPHAWFAPWRSLDERCQIGEFDRPSVRPLWSMHATRYLPILCAHEKKTCHVGGDCSYFLRHVRGSIASNASCMQLSGLQWGTPFARRTPCRCPPPSDLRPSHHRMR